MFIQDPLNKEPVVQPEPQITSDVLRVSQNMYIACSYFVERAKTKGKDEKLIKQECLNFLAMMIQKLHEEESK
jgi:hypothetical protein